MILDKLNKAELLNSPPSFVVSNTHYLVMSGSVAYGVSQPTSDYDVMGWCIPPKEKIFLHLTGYIDGFGPEPKRFNQYQQHHIDYQGTNYDLTIYSIVRYFSLTMDCNPNMIDSLFVPEDCVLHCTETARLVRDNRRLFLSKLAYHRFRGYSFSQLHKMRTKKPEGKRKSDVDEYGMDRKYAYHLVRLMNECEQILTTGDIDLRRDAAQLKSIRAGEWTMDQIIELFDQKNVYLEKLYQESELRYSPDYDSIRDLLITCLERHYGDIESYYRSENTYLNALEDIAATIRKVGLM